MQIHSKTRGKMDKQSYSKDSAEVATKFQDFLDTYDSFRETNGLSGSIANVYEILSAMSDKHGRICRQIKHYERKDAKPDWPNGMTEAMIGYIVYMIMLLKKYDVNIKDGLIKELESSVAQYSKKGK